MFENFENIYCAPTIIRSFDTSTCSSRVVW